VIGLCSYRKCSGPWLAPPTSCYMITLHELVQTIVFQIMSSRLVRGDHLSHCLLLHPACTRAVNAGHALADL
jgi:hypothetical protein